MQFNLNGSRKTYEGDPERSLLNYLREEGIMYRTDTSNESDDFLRNRIRNDLIPTLQGIDPRFRNKLEETLATLTQENELLQAVSNEAFEKVFTTTSSKQTVGNQTLFRTLHPATQKRLLIDWFKVENVTFQPSTGLFQEIVRFLVSKRGGTHTIHTDWLITKRQTKFWIEKRCGFNPPVEGTYLEKKG